MLLAGAPSAGSSDELTVTILATILLVPIVIAELAAGEAQRLRLIFLGSVK